MTPHSIPKLNAKELREFGLITGAIFAGLFGVLFPLIRSYAIPLWPWILAGILWIWALLAPATLAPVYHIWMRIGLVLGWINTRIILGVVFYVLIMPMGLIMRWLSQDPMRRQFTPNVDSYRIASTHRNRESMEKPY
jgi:predicted anti-sigma-YlaC factor YlaD